jgi:8-oxo-dGTP pyrophosphatase MutT (NUDIX family)
MEQRIRDRAEMLIISADGHEKKILLIGDGKGLYAFPGGGINVGESPKQAAIREALEEAGARLKHVKDPGLVYRRINISSGYRRGRETSYDGEKA